MTPATPAAAWVCPMFDLTEPSHSGVAGAVPAVGGQQRLRLDRVAERRAGAVRLDGVHVGRREAGVGERLRGSRAAGTGRWAR